MERARTLPVESRAAATEGSRTRVPEEPATSPEPAAALRERAVARARAVPPTPALRASVPARPRRQPATALVAPLPTAPIRSAAMSVNTIPWAAAESDHRRRRAIRTAIARTVRCASSLRPSVVRARAITASPRARALRVLRMKSAERTDTVSRSRARQDTHAPAEPFADRRGPERTGTAALPRAVRPTATPAPQITHALRRLPRTRTVAVTSRARRVSRARRISTAIRHPPRFISATGGVARRTRTATVERASKAPARIGCSSARSLPRDRITPGSRGAECHEHPGTILDSITAAPG